MTLIKRSTRSIALCCLGLLILGSLFISRPAAAQEPTSAEAATYVVARNGNGGQAGPEARPFRSGQHGVDSARAGATVRVRNGVYHEVLRIERSGTAAAPIRIVAYPGEQPILDGNTSGNTEEYELPEGDPVVCGTQDPIRCYVWTAMVTIDANHVQFSGFDVRHSRGMGIRIGLNTHPSNVTVTHCNIYSLRQRGMLIENADNVLIDHCNVFNTANFAPYSRSSSEVNWPGIVHIKQSDNVTFQNSSVYRNYGEGVIAGRDSTGIVIRNNDIFDNFALQLYVHHAHQVLVENNLIYHTNDPDFYRGDNPSYCIVVNSETNFTTSHGINGVDIYNNFIAGCRQNISLWASRDNTISFPVHNVTIAHNTLVNAHANSVTPHGITISPDADLKNIVVRNNIVYQTEGRTISNQSATPEVTFSHNLWYPERPSDVAGSGDIVADPRLMAPEAGLLPGCVLPSWYKISAESPARNAANPLADVVTDYFQAPRDAAPDMGAHEYGATATASMAMANEQAAAPFASYLPMTTHSTCLQ